MLTISKDLEIEVRLNEILTYYLDTEPNYTSSVDLNEPLIGEKYNLDPPDLICLFFDIEKNFDIEIPQADIINSKFQTITGIIDIIKKQLN